MQSVAVLAGHAGSATPSAWQLRAFFEPTLLGVEAAGAATLNQLMEWGLATYAGRGERVATVLVGWLACHQSGGGRVGLTLRYNPRLRELLITATDTGTLLPVLEFGDVLRAALAEASDLDNGAEHVGLGRRLWCVLGLLRPWRLRYTWVVPRGCAYPVHSYDRYETREDAVRAATAIGGNYPAQNGLRLSVVELCGPESETWDPVWEAP